LPLSAACLGHEQNQSALAKAGRAIHPKVETLQAFASRVVALPDTPKTEDDPPDPAVVSFLVDCAPVEQLTAAALNERVTSLTLTDGAGSRNPFEMDMSPTKPQSPFDT